MSTGLAPYRKAAMAMSGAWLTFAYIALGFDLVTEPYRTWILVVILTAQALGVYAIPNTPDLDPYNIRTGPVS